MLSHHQFTPSSHGAGHAGIHPAACDIPVPASASAGTELHRAFDAARKQWPGLNIERSRFCAHLERLGYTEKNLPRHLSEIYLCVGCGLGASQACSALDRRYFPFLRARLRSVAPEQDFAEEVLQRVRDRLLVGSKPRINTYRGDGPLSGWLRVVANNVAKDYLRSHTSQCSRYLSDTAARHAFFSTSESTASAASPEDDVLAAHDAHTLEQGLLKAVLGLTNEERQLLHHHFVSGLTVDVLGPMYSVNRSTAARRIQRSVGRIRRAIRAELSTSAISLGDVDSGDIWRTLGKRLNVNAAFLLRFDAEPR